MNSETNKMAKNPNTLDKLKDYNGNILKEGFYTNRITLYYVERKKEKPEWRAYHTFGEYVPVHAGELSHLSSPKILSKELQPINPKDYLKNKKFAEARIKLENRSIKRFIEDCINLPYKL